MPCRTSAVPQHLDMRNRASCVEALSELARAYYSILSGQSKVMVRFQERWVEYQKANAQQLLDAYNTLYRQCPGAQAAGLPDLNPGLVARRGPPMRGFNVFGRL